MDLTSCLLAGAILAAVTVVAGVMTGWPPGQGFWLLGSASTFLLYALTGLTVVLTFILVERVGRNRR